jgi:PucR-like helix-turn-helix protein
MDLPRIQQPSKQLRTADDGDGTRQAIASRHANEDAVTDAPRARGGSHHPAVEAGLQQIVDALSVRLGRPVVVDDVDLRPLAYSIQFGELDAVRTESILGRAAPDAARSKVFSLGIRTALEPVRIPADPAIGMEARLCLPILRAGRRLGFLWLIEDRPIGDDELHSARVAVASAAAVLQSEADSKADRRRREQELISALLSPDGRASAAAAALLEAGHYIPPRPLRVCVGTGSAVQEGLDRFRARVPVKHTLCGEIDGRATCIVGAQTPLRGAQLAEALRGAGPAARVHVGEGHAIAALGEAPTSHRRALAALRVAVDREEDVARWDDLRAYRLLTALPATALDDIPAGLRGLLGGGHEQLVLTLETYLDHAGDVKRTAAELWLHRTSLYYRLRRIEEVTGVDLSRGEDRLLCHVALRLSRLAQRA